MDIKGYIVEKSQELAIDLIGFTDGQPMLDIESFLLEKRKKDKFTSFEEEDIEKRLDPKLSLPNCKSVIVVGLSYNTGYSPYNGEELIGSLSKSSWGLDYHRVLKEKMDALVDLIKEKTPFQHRAFVDTGPLVDRHLAKKAGLGYYGKNCSIINKKYGSYIFLGYILTDLDIELDEKILSEECGDCTLCIEACPTGALEKKYYLNPKKCISYLTQTKDRIPEDLRRRMGISIYGCDICQKVCPKNKDVEYSKNPDFIPVKSKGVILIPELLSMSNRKFKEKYGHMAASWRGKNTLKRNAIIALGNIKDKNNLHLLYQEERKATDFLKEYIQWSIDEITLFNK